MPDTGDVWEQTSDTDAMVISDTEHVVEEARHFAVVRKTRHGEAVHPAIYKPFMVEAVYRTDEEVLLEGRDHGPFRGVFEDVVKRLQRNGNVVDRRRAEQVLRALMDANPNQYRAQPYWAVYSNNGALHLPDHVMSSSDEVMEIASAMQKDSEYTPTDDDWRAYRDIRSLFHPHEILPTQGIAAIAPFARVLRAHEIMVPYVMAYSMKTSTGKTKSMRAHSTRLFGGRDYLGGTLNSEFRLIHLQQAGAAPILFNEAEKIQWDKYADALKTGPEQLSGNARGTKAMRLVRYEQPATFFCTTNHLQLIPADIIERWLICRFDEGRRPTPQEKERMAAVLERMKPLGAHLVQAYLDAVPDEGQLLRRHGDLAREIRDVYGRSFEDARREAAWASCLLGLQIWDLASGGIVECPSVADFVTGVVKPIEHDSHGMRLDPMEDLRSFMQDYMVRMEDRRADPEAPTTYRGEGDTWAFQSINSIGGFLLTRGTMQQYQKDCRQRGIQGFTQMADVSRASVREHDQVNEADLLDGQGTPKTFGAVNRKRAAWISELPPDNPRQKQETIVETSNDHNNRRD